jgi:hypothetical protein
MVRLKLKKQDQALLDMYRGDKDLYKFLDDVLSCMSDYNWMTQYNLHLDGYLHLRGKDCTTYMGEFD